MSHERHKILKCKECKKVILQCRCFDNNKSVQWSTCWECLLSERLLDELAKALTAVEGK